MKLDKSDANGIISYSFWISYESLILFESVTEIFTRAYKISTQYVHSLGYAAIFDQNNMKVLSSHLILQPFYFFPSFVLNTIWHGNGLPDHNCHKQKTLQVLNNTDTGK